MTPKPKPFKWRLRTAAPVIFGIMLWAELAHFLIVASQSTPGTERFAYAVAFFFVIGLPLLALLVYRFRLVFDFFRSIHVGVTNLVLVGLSSISGVLFYQENPDFPMPQDAVESLAEHVSQGETSVWTLDQRRVWQHFEEFRFAHTYFTYHLLHGKGLHLLPGVAPECTLDDAEISDKLELLDGNLVPIRSRFGDEFAIALEAKSGTGLAVRQQNAEIAEFETAWPDFWWSTFVWANRLDFLRVYHSIWFAALWFIVFCGVLSNTFRGGWRRLLKPGKFGFVITHCGVMTLLLSAFWGRVTEERGMLQLHLGRTSDRFTLYSGEPTKFYGRGMFGKEESPFMVRLDAFRADYHDVLDVVYAERNDSGLVEEFPAIEPPRHRVHDGQTSLYDWGPANDDLPEGLLDSANGNSAPWLKVEVVSYHSQADVKPVLRVVSGGEAGVPIARFQAIDSNGEVEFEQLLFHHFPRPFFHQESGTRVLYRMVADVEELRSFLTEPITDSFGELSLSGTDGVTSSALALVIPGSSYTVNIDGQPFEVEVVDAAPVVRLRKETGGNWINVAEPENSGFQNASNPGVLLSITNQDGEVEQRWVMNQGSLSPPSTFAELKTEFRWNEWTAPGGPRYWLFQLADGSCQLGLAGQLDSLREISPGESFSLDDAHQGRLAEAELKAQLADEIKPLSGVDFFHPAAGAITVRATTPNGVDEFNLVAKDQGDWHEVNYLGPDGSARIALLHFHIDTQDLPVEWQSKLTMLEQGGGDSWDPVTTGAIRVNDYFHYKGYRFFQTDARPDDPTYSGIGIVYDPGIETVLLGLYMVMFGVMIVFFINPMVTRKHRGS